MYDYRAEVLRVIDGDTVRLRVDLGCDIRLDLTCRLAGVNAPEMPTPAGVVARSYVAAWLGEHEDDAGRVGLRTVRDTREKYGRYLADLYDLGDADAPPLASALISTGNAVPYHPR